MKPTMTKHEAFEAAWARMMAAPTREEFERLHQEAKEAEAAYEAELYPLQHEAEADKEVTARMPKKELLLRLKVAGENAFSHNTAVERGIELLLEFIGRKEISDAFYAAMEEHIDALPSTYRRD